MKQCPACDRTYVDDALLFCLEDGSLLLPATAPGEDAGYDPSATLAYPAARETNPPFANVYPQAARQPAPYAPVAQHAGKPNARPWIIAAAAVVFALVIGIVVLLAIIGRSSTNESKGAGTATGGERKTQTPVAANFLKDDFSRNNWPTGEAAFGSFYQDGEYHMKGQPNLYFYQFPLDPDSYSSKDASVKVTARSVDGKSPQGGFGLLVHGRAGGGNRLRGYAFLIYTGAPTKYQLARVDDGKLNAIIPWTDSAVIRGGTNTNQIEVRAAGAQLSLYVNGQFLKSVADTAGYTGGTIGLYTSETSEVAFDDLEISR